jgi:hypothetical protein
MILLSLIINKWFVDTLSIAIGMNLRFAPQISEHCPYRTPGRLIENLNWFKRPGVASVFTPSLGTVHECTTSADVTIIRIGDFIGSTTRLSVSSTRVIIHTITIKMKNASKTARAKFSDTRHF